MPLSEGASVVRPETALLKWAEVPRRSDVGQLCYLRRNTSHRQRGHHYFDESSLSLERIEAVRKLILYLSDTCRSGAYRPFTLADQVRCLTLFLNWSDSANMHNTLCQEESTKDALQAYFKTLREDVSQSKRNRNSVANTQRTLLSFLREFFGNYMFGADIRPISGARKFTNNTVVPDEGITGPLLAWANALFGAVAEHVDTARPYPVEMCGPGGTIWLLPTQLRVGTTDTSERDAWDIHTGRLLSCEAIAMELKARGVSAPDERAKKLRRHAQSSLAVVNSNPQDNVRLSHAITASYSFAVLFLAETGINLSQLLDMSWSEEFEEAMRSPVVTRQKFREIKYRAGGKVVTFRISIAFVPQLKRYLQLRRYLCQGKKVGPLFVAFSINRQPKKLSEQFIRLLYDRLQGVGIPLPRIHARQWRAVKQDWVVRKHGPVVAAKVLNHTLETALRSYSNGTESALRAEFGAFFKSLENTILAKDEQPANAVESSIGICVDFRQPTPVSASVPVKPDCRSSEGCLFCDKYRIHADETDIRKLLSCRHCMRLTSNLASSIEEYDRTFGTVLRRVDFLLEELQRRDPDTFHSIERDVDINGNLDPFWAGKLEQLFELELV